MDQQERNALITADIGFARNIGERYAGRHKLWADEAVAEALFHLVEYYDSIVFKKFGRQEIQLRRYIYLGLIDYFRGASAFRRNMPKSESLDVVDKAIVKKNMDAEMLDWLSGLMGNDQDSSTVLGYLREGLTFDELEFLQDKLVTVSRSIYKLTANRLRRLIKLKRLGVEVTRDVYGRFPQDEPELQPATEVQLAGVDQCDAAA